MTAKTITITDHEYHMIQFTPKYAAFGAHRSGARIDADPFHRGQVDDQTSSLVP